jgi:uncharacterized protein (TIGR01777 family)
MKILITGGTGLIGKALSAKLIAEGHQIIILSRSKKQNSDYQTFEWNPENGYVEDGALVGVEAIVHLAGAGIADKRWTSERKKELIESRTKSLEVLSKYVDRNSLKVLIGGSAIGYYGGDTGDNWKNTDSPAGNDFLAECTVLWEKAEQEFAKKHHLRYSIIRTGVVLSLDGGALPKLLMPIKLNLGAPLGSGKQWISWIHLTDLVEMFYRALINPESPILINGVAPQPKTNHDFNAIAAKILQKKYFLPAVPSVFIKLALGEMSVVVLGSSRVKGPADFSFKFPNLETALKNILDKN